ncbi:MAG: hypothetical protein L0G99_14400, partial [Propionibacteriales bacterium]|nr:hypothetical protein [Propionibacteriales bacterium]
MDITVISQFFEQGRPSAQVAAAANLHRREQLHLHGHDDLSDSAESLASKMRDSPDRRKIWLSAADEGRVVGDASAVLPQQDNTTLAQIDLTADPDADMRAVLTPLWNELAERVRAEGRTVAQSWTGHRLPTDGTETLTPASGVGLLPCDAMTDFLLGEGFTLEQAERQSTLVVAAARDSLDQHLEHAHARADTAYEILTWAGPSPDELVADLAELYARMSIDVPTAGLESEPERWDVDRVRRNDQRAIDAGRTRISTVARHRATGALVAYTDIDHPLDKPAAAFQEDTLVHGDHRGHRLGLLIKAANLRA